MKHGKTAYRRPSNVPLMDSPETPPCIGTSSNKSKDTESDIDFSDVEEEELTSITNMDDLIKVQSDEDEKQNLHPDIKDLPSSFVFPKNLVTMKSTSRNSELGICFGVSQIIGGRSYQEDPFVCVPRLVRSKKDSVAFFAVYVCFSLCEPHLDSKHSTQQQLRRTQRKSYLDHASRASSHLVGKTNRIRVLNIESRKGSDHNLYRARPFLYCGNTCTSEGGRLG